MNRIILANELVDAAALRWLAGELDRDPEFEFTCWVDSERGVELMTEALRGTEPSGRTCWSSWVFPVAGPGFGTGRPR